MRYCRASEATMKDYVWCINSTTAFTLKNSVPKTALCCTEDTSEREKTIHYMSLTIPIVLAVADFPLDNLKDIDRWFQKSKYDDKEANKNKPLDAAIDA